MIINRTAAAAKDPKAIVTCLRPLVVLEPANTEPSSSSKTSSSLSTSLSDSDQCERGESVRSSCSSCVVSFPALVLLLSSWLIILVCLLVVEVVVVVGVAEPNDFADRRKNTCVETGMHAIPFVFLDWEKTTCQGFRNFEPAFFRRKIGLNPICRLIELESRVRRHIIDTQISQHICYS
jgi:hypothetical protein